MNVVIYARVSSEKQDIDLSITAQLKALREYARRNGHHIVREFVDEAESGRTSARPAFREMITLARRLSKPFSAVIVWKYSRFARSREDSILYKTMLKKAGVQVISINEPFEDSPTGRLMEGIIESLDEFYSDNLGEDVTRGMRESAARGFYLSARPPYGYRKVRVQDGVKARTKLQPEPTQVSTIVNIYDAVINGEGPIDIVRNLNKKGVPGPTGKGWSKSVVHSILTNEIYTGVFVWGRNSKRGLPPVRTENACPPIIDRASFLKVQAIMKERTPVRVHPRRVASPFLLSGLAHCGYCGKSLVARYAKGGRFAYYVCGTLDKKGAGACPAKYLNADQFERAVIEQIKKHVLTRENLEELVKLTNRELDASMESQQAELAAISQAIEDTSRRLDKLYDAVETGKLELEDLAPRIREQRQRQAQLQAHRIEIESAMSDRRVELIDLEMMTAYITDMQSVLQEGTLLERKAFIRSFVKEIHITGDEAVLTYSMPELPEKVSLDKAGVPRIEQRGGR
jgi:site-specific DNA recombinase